MDTIKRSLLAAVAGLALVASGAFAQNVDSMKTAPTVSQAVQLSDAELDNITAGGVLVSQVVMNPGKASFLRFDDKHFFCINCTELSGSGIERGVAILRPGTPPTPIVQRCVGAGCP